MPLILALLAAAGVTASAADKIRIVTSIPDLADFARQIGGSLVEVESLATGVEDPHAIPMRPSFVSRLNRADLVILLGLDNEHAFLPSLLDAAKNPKIRLGRPGYVDTSRGITPLQIPVQFTRAEGDVHPTGNPHYNLDPVRARVIVQNITSSLITLYPQHEAKFVANRDAYLAKLDAKITEWMALAAPLKGLKFVSYHANWPYFSERFGLVPAGTIELKPGVEPTPRHLKDLVEMMKAEGVKVIIREPHYAERLPAQVAAQTGAKVARLAIMVGGVPEAKTYLDLIDYNLRALLNAAK
jgi:ABC-type Zn uptake system ZnuABC Zn-binding protein ZnuA